MELPRVRHRRVVGLDRPEPGLVQANRRRTVRSARPAADGGGVVPAAGGGSRGRADPRLLAVLGGHKAPELAVRIIYRD